MLLGLNVAAFEMESQYHGGARTAEAERIREFRTDFAEVRITIEEMVAEGDRVTTRVTVGGTQARSLSIWSSPDTGQPMERESFALYRVACGQIARDGSCLTT